MIHFIKNEKQILDIFNLNIREINKQSNEKINYINSEKDLNDKFIEISKKTNIKLNKTNSIKDINSNFLIINKKLVVK